MHNKCNWKKLISLKALDMVSFSFLFSVLLAFSGQTGTNAYSAGPVNTSAVNKSVLLQLVNNARKKGCNCGDTYYPSAPAITWNEQLEKAAADHSKDMEKNNYFSHYDKKGHSAAMRINRAGYRWAGYAENIALGYASEKEVVEGWLKSPGHCSNIMSRSYKEMGVARSGGYWTQVLATK